MKYRIKNCYECAYWNSPQRFNRSEYCVDHRDLKDQPPGIEKAIKKVKRELWKERIVYGIFALIASGLTVVAWITPRSWLDYFASVLLGIFLIMIIFLIIKIEKEAKKELKALNQKKSEWIIWYE